MKVKTLNPDLEGHSDYKSEKPFYVLMPAYNEAGHPFFINTVQETVKTKGLGKLIVIDDGSTDGTTKKIKSLQQNHLIDLISYPDNLGKEGAIKEGLKHLLNSTYFTPDSWLVLMDSDGQHKPKDIPKLLYAAEFTQADMVGSYRSYRKMPLSRICANYGTQLLMRYVWRVPLKDVLCGFRAVKGNWAKLLSLSLDDHGGYRVELSLVYNLTNHGAKFFCEIPIETEYVNYSKQSGMGLMNNKWIKQTLYIFNKGSDFKKIYWLNWMSKLAENFIK